MKKFKKFLLYFFGFLVVCYLIIDSVDYPDEYQRKMVEEQQQTQVEKPTEQAEQTEQDDSPKSFSEEVRDMAGGMNDMVATIRRLKEGIKTARCGGKLIFQLWKIDMRLDDVPDDIAYEAFIEEGVKVHELDIFSMDREETTAEQLAANYEERLTELYRRFSDDPSEINTHKALKLCAEKSFEKKCSQEQLDTLTDNLSDSLDSWLLKLETNSHNDLSRIGDYINMAINAPIDQRLQRDMMLNRYHLVNSVTGDRRLSYTLASSSGNFSYNGINAINRYCKSILRDERCILIANRLEQETSEPWQKGRAFSIKESYFEAEGNDEAIKKIETERGNLYGNSSNVKTPLFSDEYIDYALETIPLYDRGTAERLLDEKAQELLMRDPGMCAF